MMVKEKKEWNIFLTMSSICSSTNSEPAAVEQLMHKFQCEVGKLSKKKKEHFNLCKEELSLHLVC